jgi:hypothetical protein
MTLRLPLVDLSIVSLPIHFLTQRITENSYQGRRGSRGHLPPVSLLTSTPCPLLLQAHKTIACKRRGSPGRPIWQFWRTSRAAWWRWAVMAEFRLGNEGAGWLVPAGAITFTPSQRRRDNATGTLNEEAVQP